MIQTWLRWLAAELEVLVARITRLEETVQYSLLPRDATEDRDALVEIRAGTGEMRQLSLRQICLVCTNTLRNSAGGV